MTAKSTWTPMIADVYAKRYGEVAQDFLSLVVEPSLAALEQKRAEIAAQPDQIVAAFHLYDHCHLMSKTSMALCLGIQSLWEQQLREYLGNCGSRVHLSSSTRSSIQGANWGISGRFPSLNQLFGKIRGLELESFESYKRLDKLQLLGNVCRHGEGGSAVKLRTKYPELWPSSDADSLRSLHDMLISTSLLRDLVNAVVLFWLDLDIACTEGLIPSNPTMINEVEKLRALRPALL